MDVSERIDAFQRILIDIFAELTKLPIAIVVIRNGQKQLITTDISRSKYKAHCRLIRSFDGGERCDSDEVHRADRAFYRKTPSLLLCHAGMFNQEVPIVVDKQVRAVVLYGQFQHSDPQRQQAALAKHQEASIDLKLTDDQRRELREAFRQERPLDDQTIEKYQGLLKRMQEALYLLLEEERLQIENYERIMHELQTRVQALIGDADKLVAETPYTTLGVLKRHTENILVSAEALATIVQSLEDHTADYDFMPQPIEPLLQEARRIYEREARNRNIDIYIQLAPMDNGRAPILRISKDHLQLAFNNLMHNAIKYSFKGSVGRPSRYVFIRGKPSKSLRYYEITFENYGVGIKPEEIANRTIFQKNNQGKLTHGEFRSGAGKGLYFVEQIVRRHHGDIHVQSEMAASPDSLPEGQPHKNQFIVRLPYEQPKEE